MTDKPIPKSLHTVTVLVNVTRLIQRLNNESRESALTSAIEALGYRDVPDSYGLRAKANAILKP